MDHPCNPNPSCKGGLVCRVVALFAILTLLAVDSTDVQAAPQRSTADRTSAARARKTPPPPTAKVRRYVERVIAEYDADGDGQLQNDEWENMRGDPAPIDIDRDGTITNAEFARYIAQFAARRRIRLETPEPPPPADEPLLQPIGRSREIAERKATAAKTKADGISDKSDPPASEGERPEPPPAVPPRTTPRRRDQKYYVAPSRIPTGLPSWFQSRDRDGDAQISMAEYSPSMTPATLAEFRRYDTNGDGMITGEEYLRKTKAGKSSKSDKAARPPKKGR